MGRPVGRARRESREVIERMMVRLEGIAARSCVDDLAFFLRRLTSIFKREIPAACVPCPAHILGGQGVADGLQGLRRQRGTSLGSSLDIGEIPVAFWCGR